MKSEDIARYIAGLEGEVDRLRAASVLPDVGPVTRDEEAFAAEEWQPQPCPRCRTVNCKWVDDRIGFRCPQCALFVAQPRRLAAPAPAPADIDEQFADALSETSLDEEEVQEAVAAVMRVLNTPLDAEAAAADTTPTGSEAEDVSLLDALDLFHDEELAMGVAISAGDACRIQRRLSSLIDAHRAARTSEEAGQ